MEFYIDVHLCRNYFTKWALYSFQRKKGRKGGMKKWKGEEGAGGGLQSSQSYQTSSGWWYGGRLHSYLELEPRQGLGFLSAFSRIFLLHSCVIIFLWKIKELYYKVCRKAVCQTIRTLCIQPCHWCVSAFLYKSKQHIFETLRCTEQF